MKAAISKLNCAARIGLIICFNAISNAGAQPGGSIEVNEDAIAFAYQLIQKGRLIADRKGAWREHKPSPDMENEFIRAHGLAEYAKWHLAVDERYRVNTKGRYKFPYGDFKNVHRCGLLAVQARARQYGYGNIEKAAAELERAMKAQAGDRDRSFAFANLIVFHPCKSMALKLPDR